MQIGRQLWLTVIFVSLAMAATVRAEEDHKPIAIVMPEPRYPYELSKAGIKGNVLVEFIIGADGRVLQAKAVKSTNRGFEPAAIEAILKWKFKPGIKKGRAVNVRAQQLIEFNVLEHTLVYPFNLLIEGKEGNATVGYWLDENSRLTRSEVLNATDPEFGKAAQAMLADELVNSTAKEVSPTGGMYRTTYTFKSDGSGQASVTAATREILNMVKKGKTNFSQLDTLDKPVAPISRLAPIFPVALRNTQPSGSVVIEFFIDREGRAQLPRVVSATHEDFGYAAVQAVGQWNFKPPVQQGQPVIVKTRVPIEFTIGGETK